MEKQRYYISTAIAYTSGKPHIGNTYEVVLADAIARFKRQQGYDVYFQTGTDEHGQKIELKAEEAGVTPKEFVDNVSGEIKRIWDRSTEPSPAIQRCSVTSTIHFSTNATCRDLTSTSSLATSVPMQKHRNVLRQHTKMRNAGRRWHF